MGPPRTYFFLLRGMVGWVALGGRKVQSIDCFQFEMRGLMVSGRGGFLIELSTNIVDRNVESLAFYVLLCRVRAAPRADSVAVQYSPVQHTTTEYLL